MNVERPATPVRAARSIPGDAAAGAGPGQPRRGQAVSRCRGRRLAAAAIASAAVTAAAAVLVWAPAGQRASDPVDDPPLEPLGDVPAWVDQAGDVHIGERVLDLPEPSQAC